LPQRLAAIIPCGQQLPVQQAFLAGAAPCCHQRVFIVRQALLFCFLAMLLPANVRAEPVKETEDFRTCMDAVDLGAFKNTQWAACYDAELLRQDMVLNDTYRRLAASLDAEAKAALVRGERSWLAYRDHWCLFEGKTPMAPGGEVNRSACLLELTLLQINKLGSLIVE
jgi:uncharacterized protein YecT (DUF1311 family)